MPKEFEVIKCAKQEEATNDPPLTSVKTETPGQSPFIVVAIEFVEPSLARIVSMEEVKFDSKLQIEGDIAKLDGREIGKVVGRKSSADVRINTAYSIKYTGGYSKDGKTIYLDSRFPKIIVVDGKEIDTVDTIARHHELPEKWFVDEGYTYQYAHIIATKIEREYVESLGTNWESYSKEVEKHLHEVSSAPLQISPKDLDLAPYSMSGDTKTLDEIEATKEK
ncbi:MAG: hypothetical protein QXR58_00730 [Candidatus Micrarchaeaceae archaeon]